MRNRPKSLKEFFKPIIKVATIYLLACKLNDPKIWPRLLKRLSLITPLFLKGDHLTILTPKFKFGINKPLLNAIIDIANLIIIRNEPSE